MVKISPQIIFFRPKLSLLYSMVEICLIFNTRSRLIFVLNTPKNHRHTQGFTRLNVLRQVSHHSKSTITITITTRLNVLRQVPCSTPSLQINLSLTPPLSPSQPISLNLHCGFARLSFIFWVLFSELHFKFPLCLLLGLPSSLSLLCMFSDHLDSQTGCIWSLKLKS